MYLKALEIQGFKSFPDRTILPFAEEITAVVGPNGSGKSNISDAIRWVVGEQSSKTLRGAKMEDVVFGGTEKRKQNSFAQVSLVMDNSTKLFDMEETEVMITRKYFRSGESEYFINKHQVRLRDINELFMGTGLGKEGYAVIGQGRIDEILSVKSSQRREVFEEAAGIAKFRHQKEESERKLERAQENLLRIEDKIDELERQVEPLEKQSDTAKKFLIFRDELRKLEISVWLEQLRTVQVNKIKIHADFDQGVEERNKVQEELNKLYEKSETLTVEIQEKAVELEKIRNDLTEKEAVVSEGEGEISLLKNTITNNQSNAKRLSESLEQKEAREQELNHQIREQQEKLEALAARRITLEKDYQEKCLVVSELEVQVQNATGELGRLRQEEGLKTLAVGDAKSKLSALTSSTQEIMDQDVSLRQEISSLEQKVGELENNLKNLEQEKQEAIEGKEAGLNAVEGYALRVEGRRNKINGLRSKQEQLSRDIHAKEAKRKLLTDMEQMYEGFSGAVKQVMQEAKRGSLGKIYGPVADLITVSGDYAVAIETALGGAMQNIVVGQFADGKGVLYYLKNRNRGERVTCMPLDTMKPRFLSQKNALEKEQGFIGVASELLAFDPIYHPVMGNLLGNVAIMENIDCANVTAKKFNHQFRIVTLDGQVLNAGGSMTGGSNNKNKSAGILGRKDELETLKKEIEKNRVELGTLDQEIGDLETLVSGDQYQLDIAKNDLRSFEDAVLRLEGGCQSSGRELATFQGQWEQRKQQLDGLAERTEKIQTSTQEAQKRMEEEEAIAETLRQQQEEGSQTLTTLQQQWQSERDLSTNLQSQRSSLDVEERSIGEVKENLEGQLQGILGERAENSNLIADFQEKNKEFDLQIQTKDAEIQEGRKECETLRSSLRETSQERDVTEAARNQADKDSREKSNTLNNLERNVAGLEQKKNATELEEAQILGKFWDSYELTHEAAKQEQVEVESLAQATRRISELSRDIKALGNINIDAIEEFEKINERYTYYTDQRDDIAGAKKELEKIIEGIVAEMAEIFEKEFYKINEAFSEIFVILFGGGHAQVLLEDKEDVLGSGIEIKAQPPGKALKTLSLMSGGEKALIAIALYFAILRIRPCPFVVMDEIEAALDDSNIERFVKYLRQIADKTQFIIITHRRGSMEAADVLYGITMQEKGVSRMLRLSLNEVEDKLGMEL